MSSSLALVFDTETTGKTEPHIIEAAWIEVDLSLNEFDRYSERFNPGKPIETGAMAVHHIVDSDLHASRPHTDFSLPQNVGYLIGHNIDYDWKVAGEPPIRRICTLALSRYLFPGVDSYIQSALMYRFFGEAARAMVQHAHSALTDVENCLKLLGVLLEELKARGESPDSWEALWKVSEVARIPRVMPFGKHKGELIRDLPQDYRNWMLRQLDLDPYLERALREA